VTLLVALRAGVSIAADLLHFFSNSGSAIFANSDAGSFSAARS
jgi:hypothetical protein